MEHVSRLGVSSTVTYYSPLARCVEQYVPGMKRLVYLVVVLCLTSNVGAQSITFTSSRYESQAQHATIFQRETTRIERLLTRSFPVTRLRKVARESTTPLLRKVAYEVLYHGGVKYLIAVQTARWDVPVNQLSIYALSGPYSGGLVWRSKPWRSIYFGNDLQQVKVGNRTIVMLKEGGIAAGDYGVASVFSLTRWKDNLYVRDLTPVNPSLEMQVDFPFRALYGQNIMLSSLTIPNSALILSANDRMYKRGGEFIQPRYEWTYDRVRSRFLSMDSKLTVSGSASY